MAEQKKGQIQIFAKNIKGSARGEIREDAKYIKNIAGGRHVQNGSSGGVKNDVNQPRKALRIVKVEGPFNPETGKKLTLLRKIRGIIIKLFDIAEFQLIRKRSK